MPINTAQLARCIVSRAVICILERTNLVDAHEDVLLCIEDFLWIKLAQIQISNEVAFNDRTHVQLTIPRLQRWILRDLGEDYFKAYEQPLPLRSRTTALRCVRIRLRVSLEESVDKSTRRAHGDLLQREIPTRVDLVGRRVHDHGREQFAAEQDQHGVESTEARRIVFEGETRCSISVGTGS